MSRQKSGNVNTARSRKSASSRIDKINFKWNCKTFCQRSGYFGIPNKKDWAYVGDTHGVYRKEAIKDFSKCGYCNNTYFRSNCFCKAKPSLSFRPGSKLHHTVSPIPRMLYLEDEDPTTAKFLGVELEFASEREITQNEKLHAEVEKMYKMYKTSPSIIHDGTVNDRMGIEMVLPPATYAWYLNHGNVYSMLDLLGGESSLLNETTSVHIHVSKHPFTKEELTEIFTEFYQNPMKHRIYGGNKNISSINRYSNFESLSDMDWKHYFETGKEGIEGYKAGKYFALNDTSNTIEFRHMRGINTYEGLMKRIIYIAELVGCAR